METILLKSKNSEFKTPASKCSLRLLHKFSLTSRLSHVPAILPVSPILQPFAHSISTQSICLSPIVNHKRNLFKSSLNPRSDQTRETVSKDIQTEDFIDETSFRPIKHFEKRPKRILKKRKKLVLVPQTRKWFDCSIIPNNNTGLELEKMMKYFKRSKRQSNLINSQ